MLIDQVSGIFPIEASLMTVEVKSELSLCALRAAHASAAKVAQFRHAPRVGAAAVPTDQPETGRRKPRGKTEKQRKERIEHVVPYLLAFDTDLTLGGKSEVERYDEALAGVAPSILGICAVGRSFWFRDKDTWIEWKFPTQYGEVVGFITTVVNICQRIASTRFQPDLRWYVQP
jgi:hypothetical protein